MVTMVDLPALHGDPAPRRLLCHGSWVLHACGTDAVGSRRNRQIEAVPGQHLPHAHNVLTVTDLTFPTPLTDLYVTPPSIMRNVPVTLPTEGDPPQDARVRATPVSVVPSKILPLVVNLI